MFKNPFSFNGRIRRAEYALSLLIYIAGALLAGYVADLIHFSSGVTLLLIPVIWFTWAQGAKRCHDLGNSGFYQIIPFYGLWMLFAAGHEGENAYGPDPDFPENLTNPEVLDDFIHQESDVK
jgi:uncharacterized membrane protein YhaH (DUF805 family)